MGEQQDINSDPIVEEVSRGIDRGIDRLESRRDAKQERRLAGELRGQRVRGGAERLLTRTLSGAIYVIIFAGCLYLGPAATVAAVSAMAWLCCSEFFHLARLGGRMPNEVLGLTIALAYPIATWQLGAEAFGLVSFILLVGCAVWYVVTPRAGIGDIAITAFGPIYTSFSLSTLVLIRTVDEGYGGALLALGVIASMWANDATAYLVGSRIGKHKLAPRISPKKSIEGFWGGLVACVIMWLVLALLGIRGITWPFALITGPVVGVVAVIGDLFESRIKRGVGVKDSGDIMPGHGGLLDRSDSILFGCMAAYLMLRLGGFL